MQTTLVFPQTLTIAGTIKLLKSQVDIRNSVKSVAIYNNLDEGSNTYHCHLDNIFHHKIYNRLPWRNKVYIPLPHTSHTLLELGRGHPCGFFLLFFAPLSKRKEEQE